MEVPVEAVEAEGLVETERQAVRVETANLEAMEVWEALQFLLILFCWMGQH
jgi:hypothetical protein